MRPRALAPQLKRDPLGSHTLISTVSMDERLAIMLGSTALTLAVCFLTACGGASAIPPVASKPTPRPSPWCVTPGSEVDSTVAVAQARTLFASTDEPPLKPHSEQRVMAHLEGKNSKDSTFSLNFPEGWLVRLMPVAPITLGGGGLVWVDSETGCPILLIHYE